MSRRDNKRGRSPTPREGSCDNVDIVFTSFHSETPRGAVSVHRGWPGSRRSVNRAHGVVAAAGHRTITASSVGGTGAAAGRAPVAWASAATPSLGDPAVARGLAFAALPRRQRGRSFQTSEVERRPGDATRSGARSHLACSRSSLTIPSVRGRTASPTCISLSPNRIRRRDARDTLGDTGAANRSVLATSECATRVSFMGSTGPGRTAWPFTLRPHSLGGLYEKIFLGTELAWLLVAAVWIASDRAAERPVQAV